VVGKLADLGGRLSRIDGGNKRNALPRDAAALVFFPKARLGEAQAAVSSVREVVRAEFSTVEPGLEVAAAPARASGGRVFKRSLQKKLVQVLAAMPHGVIKMSADIPGLVETSTNLAVITTGRKSVSITTSQRSSVESERDEIAGAVRAVLELGGATTSGSDGYAGWKPNLASPILKTAITTYQRLHGKEPEVKAIHAGLECGIIGDKYPGMDMLSFGPSVEGGHSPDEKIYVDSVQPYWNYLLAILEAVS
jgi:dipeptidase D